jgi:hypothetical protein
MLAAWTNRGSLAQRSMSRSGAGSPMWISSAPRTSAGVGRDKRWSVAMMGGVSSGGAHSAVGPWGHG